MANYDKYSRIISTDPGSRNAFPDGINQVAVSGGPYLAQRWVFNMVAGAGGSADDVTLEASLPFKCFLLNTQVVPTATVSMGTVTLRTAAAGGGSALSSAVACAAPGTLGSSTGATAIGTALAAGTAIYARRSDSGVAGVLIVDVIPTV